MKLNLTSWNIPNLCMYKVDTYLDKIVEQAESGHVLFFYENEKCNDMGREFVDAIGNRLSKSKALGSRRVEWGGYRYDVGTNELVWILHSKLCKTRPKSPTWGQKALDYGVGLEAQHWLDPSLKDAATKALKNSMNLTVLSELSMGRAKFRIPAVVDVILNKPDGKVVTVRVAA